jgi:VanZ family protein
MRFLKYNGPVILWAILILVLTGLPGNYFPKVPTIWDLLEPDKIVHLAIFLVFTLLLIYAIIHSRRSSKRFLFILATGTGIVFGAATELLQAWVFTWRQASVYDFIADAIGCLAGYLLFKKLLKTKWFENRMEI